MNRRRRYNRRRDVRFGTMTFNEWAIDFHWKEKYGKAVRMHGEETQKLLDQIKKWRECMRYYKDAATLLYNDKRWISESNKVQSILDTCDKYIRDMAKVIEGLYKVLDIARN